MKIKKYIVVAILLVSSVAYGSAGEWCVQISTFRNIDGIKQDFQKVKNNKEARIERIGDTYVLRVGSFSSELRAKKALPSFRDEFPKAYVRRCANDPDRIIISSQPPKPNSNGKSANEPGVKAADKSAKGPKQEAVPVRMPDKASQSAPAAEAVPKPSKADVLNPSVKTADPVAPQGIPAFRHTLPKTPPASPPATATTQSSSRELPAGPAAPATPVAPASSAPPSGKSDLMPPVHASEPARLFDEAEKHRLGGNYTLAIDLYKKVMELAIPNGELAGRAAYRLALCYDIIGEKRMSEASYAQAIDKWPGLDIAPAPILYAGGMKAYEDKKYEGALKIFSLYMTVYPEEKRRAEYMTACTFMQQGRLNAAMFLFSRVIDQYPDSNEALESIVAFGHIGLMVPRVKASMFLSGHEWWRDPISAYDTAIKRRTDIGSVEHILYAKGCGLMILGRYEEAHKALLKCIKLYPSSKKIAMYETAVGMNLPRLAKLLYEREDFAGVVGAYFQSSGNNVPLPMDAATVIIIGRSLFRMGLNEDASNYLKAARIKSHGKDADEIGRAIDELGQSSDLAKSSSLTKACGDTLKEYGERQTSGQAISPQLAIRASDCLYMDKKYKESLSIYKWALGYPIAPEERRWVLLHMGKASLKVGNGDGAKQAFEELKATGVDEFWSKIAAFAYEDGKWTEKYNQISKKK